MIALLKTLLITSNEIKRRRRKKEYSISTSVLPSYIHDHALFNALTNRSPDLHIPISSC